MGTNQLLLIVMSSAIVGTAVAVGVGHVNEDAAGANRDAVAADCRRILASAAQWAQKPAKLGGGGGDYTGLALAKLGVAPVNENGMYELDVLGPDRIRVVGTGAGNGGEQVMVRLAGGADASTADFDGNGVVDFDDFAALASSWGQADERFDLDESGSVDFGDFLVFAGWFGCQMG